MTTIKVILNDQDITIVQNPLLASGDLESVILHADFSPEWDGYAKTAVFYQNEKNVFHAVLNGNGECVIPWEAMKAEGFLFFGIFGAKDDTRKTSEVVRYRIRKGAWSEETAVHDPTPDIYTQILSNVAAHAENKNNPHKVTAKQIGALIPNLLDNSDFSKPVAQLGLNGSNSHLCDRWRRNNIEAEQKDGYCQLTNTSSSTNAFIGQLVSGLAGKTLTFAVKAECPTKTFLNFRDKNGVSFASTSATSLSGILCLSATVPDNIDTVDFRFFPYYQTGGGSGDIYWAAVYEGAYTADTLPEYHPKGYANELLVCKQYDPNNGNYIGLTPDFVGAAPAGYGLGTDCQAVDSWNNAVNNGYYMSNVNAPDGYWWWGETLSYGTGSKVQRAYRQNHDNDYAVISCIRTYANEWKPWEWENPPMQPGVEYRTTERFNGEAVYTRLLTITPVYPYANVNFDYVKELVRTSIRWNNMSLPYYDSAGTPMMWWQTSHEWIYIYLQNESVANGTVYAQIWYTK